MYVIIEDTPATGRGVVAVAGSAQQARDVFIAAISAVTVLTAADRVAILGGELTSYETDDSCFDIHECVGGVAELDEGGRLRSITEECPTEPMLSVPSHARETRVAYALALLSTYGFVQPDEERRIRSRVTEWKNAHVDVSGGKWRSLQEGACTSS